MVQPLSYNNLIFFCIEIRKKERMMYLYLKIDKDKRDLCCKVTHSDDSIMSALYFIKLENILIVCCTIKINIKFVHYKSIIE